MRTTILLVEDSHADALILTRLLEDQGYGHATHWVRDGEEALQFLRRTTTENISKPDLILLDINLPKIDGWQVLKSIRETPGLRHIPVVMLTTSSHDADVTKSYLMNANCYVVKPGDLEEFEQALGHITNFWLKTAILPKGESAA